MQTTLKISKNLYFIYFFPILKYLYQLIDRKFSLSDDSRRIVAKFCLFPFFPHLWHQQEFFDEATGEDCIFVFSCKGQDVSIGAIPSKTARLCPKFVLFGFRKSFRNKLLIDELRPVRKMTRLKKLQVTNNANQDLKVTFAFTI